MKAMVLDSSPGQLEGRELGDPQPAAGELLIRVEACGACRTDVHILDGELASPKLPLVPGHQVVGRVVGAGPGADRGVGERVGVPWLGRVCGGCFQCRAGRENLCERAEFTGYTRDGGFAELVTADSRFCFALPTEPEPASLAPLLCAGLIGYRSLRMCGDEARTLGLYGFGSSAHVICQIAVAQGRKVHAFTRSGDATGQAFARSLGASWAGSSDEPPAVPLDAAIIFAPVGALVPAALRAVRPGGRVVCAGIHMSDIPSFPYSALWGERSLHSVANLTRADGEGLLSEAERVGVRCEVRTWPLEAANEALGAIRDGSLEGSAVLLP